MSCRYAIAILLFFASCKQHVAYQAPPVSKEDSVLFGTLQEQAELLQREKPDSALSILSQLASLAASKGDSSTLVAATDSRSSLLMSLGRLDEAKTLADNALALAYRIGDKKQILNALITNATFFSQTDNSDSAAYFYLKAYDMVDTNFTSKTNIAQLLNDIGMLFGREGNHSLAVTYLQKSEKITGELKDTGNLFGIYHNIIQNCNAQGNRDTVTLNKYIDKLLSSSRIANRRYINSVTLLFIANAYNKSNKKDSAILTYKQAMEAAEVDKNYQGKVFAISNLGISYAYTGATDSAEKYLGIYKRLVDPASAPIKQRINYFKSLAKIDYVKGRYKSGMDNFQQMLNNDSLLREREKKEQFYQHEKEITQLKAEKEIAKKQAQLDSQRSRIWLLTMTVLMVLLASALIIGWLAARRRKAEHLNRIAQLEATRTEQKLQNDLLQQKLAALFAQLNPHFVFNALNPLTSFIHNDQKTEANSYLHRLTVLMRGFINLSQAHFAPITLILDFLQQYISVQQERFKGAFQYEVDIDPAIDIDHEEIPALIIQPLLENAIEHGVRTAGNKGLIRLTMKRVQHDDISCIEVAVNNNGQLLPASFRIKQGHALDIITHQLAHLKQQYGVGELVIGNNADRTGVTAVLYLKTKQQKDL